jgi:replication factor C subunit 1
MDANSHPLQSAVSEVIERMDEYYLSKEDWDTILELGVDDKKDQIVAKNMSTATKTALTRKWVVFYYPIRVLLKIL